MCVNDYLAVFSAIAAIASVIVTIIVAISQNERDKNAQKIALFDKRYKIYETALKIFSFSEFIYNKKEHKLCDEDTFDAPMLASLIAESYDVFEEKEYIYKRSALLRIINEKDGEESKKADMDLYYLDACMNGKLLLLKEQILNSLRPAYFCFDNQTGDYLKKYVEALFDYTGIFKNKSAENNFRYNENFLNTINEIYDEKIFERMETLLSIKK